MMSSIRHIAIISFLILLPSCGNIPMSYRSYSERDISISIKPAEFRFIDVGQGDATLITTPNGKKILIDAGTSEMAGSRILPLLANSELELIIASHYDADHIGGIPEILKGKDNDT